MAFRPFVPQKEKPPERVAQPRREPKPSVDYSSSPAVDPAEAILRGDPTMSDLGRETAWSQFHGSKDHLELARKIQHVEMSNDTRHRLFIAKQATAPAVDHVAKVRSVIESVAHFDPNDLAAAESHPTVLKLFGDAVISKGKAKL
jgi:hypothetical protein